MVSVILVLAIRLYRLLPFRPRCPRAGASCSARGLATAQAGGGLGDVLAVIRSCAAPAGPGQFCFDMTDPCMTGGVPGDCCGGGLTGGQLKSCFTDPLGWWHL